MSRRLFACLCLCFAASVGLAQQTTNTELRALPVPGKVVIEAVDRGPGIENVDLAMQEGWSTAGPLARELGFGAGMGLPNIKKCSDQFEIHSEMSVGTRLHSEVLLSQAAPPPQPEEPL